MCFRKLLQWMLQRVQNKNNSSLKVTFQKCIPTVMSARFCELFMYEPFDCFLYFSAIKLHAVVRQLNVKFMSKAFHSHVGLVLWIAERVFLCREVDSYKKTITIWDEINRLSSLDSFPPTNLNQTVAIQTVELFKYWHIDFYLISIQIITSFCSHLTYIETLWNETWNDPMEMFCPDTPSFCDHIWSHVKLFSDL